MQSVATTISDFVMGKLLDIMSDTTESGKCDCVMFGFSKEIPKIGQPYHAMGIFHFDGKTRVLNLRTGLVKRARKLNEQLTLIEATDNGIFIIGKDRKSIEGFVK